jgi:hypothetical protein
MEVELLTSMASKSENKQTNNQNQHTRSSYNGISIWERSQLANSPTWDIFFLADPIVDSLHKYFLNQAIFDLKNKKKIEICLILL